MVNTVKKVIYEVCFIGCTPYGSLVDGYYAVDDVIYNSEDVAVTEDEILMRDLFIE